MVSWCIHKSKTKIKNTGRVNKEVCSCICSVSSCLVGEHPDLLQDGADGATPLPPPGEGDDAVRAHVVTAAHDGAAGRKTQEVIRIRIPLLVPQRGHVRCYRRKEPKTA